LWKRLFLSFFRVLDDKEPADSAFFSVKFNSSSSSFLGNEVEDDGDDSGFLARLK
jgi:hypothetical protein